MITISKIENDKYYTEDALSKHCVQKTFEIIGEDWDRIIEPSVGAGSFLTYLPEYTIYYDIEPDTALLYSEDLGKAKYSGKTVHCCLNIYHKCKDGHKQDFSIPGILECRHIFRAGKYKHSDEILNYPWDFRVSAWGRIRLLPEDHTCPNEIVFRVDDSIRQWLSEKLENCDYSKLLSCVSEPNLPAWRLRKWLKEEYIKEHNEEEI